MSDCRVRVKPRLLKIEAKGYVWCDHHCSIHERRMDVYDEDGYQHDGTPTECRPSNWRRVFVETRDPTEEF